MPQKISRSTIAASVSALVMMTTPLIAQDRQERGEAELAELLDGRVAGEPVKCLSMSQRDSLTIVDDTAFVFRDGDTYYVNRPDGASFLSDFDVPVFEPFGSRLCNLDRVEMRDRSSLAFGPSVTLREFVPYRRAKDAQISGGD